MVEIRIQRRDQLLRASPASVNRSLTASADAIRNSCAGVSPRYTWNDAVPGAKLNPVSVTLLPGLMSRPPGPETTARLRCPLHPPPRQRSKAPAPPSQRPPPPVPRRQAQERNSRPAPSATAGATNATLTLVPSVPSLAVVADSSTPNWTSPSSSSSLPSNGRGHAEPGDALPPVPLPSSPVRCCRRTTHRHESAP